MKLEKGNIYKIPVSPEYFGIGEIVAIPDEDYFIFRVFKKIYTVDPDTVEDSVLLLGATMDAKIYAGHWTKLHNIPIRTHSKVSENAGVLNHPINNLVNMLLGKSETSVHDLTIVAPVRFELALKAYHNLGQWKAEFDTILFHR